MSRGGSYGGGQSSLGYLFGSEEPKTPPPAAKPVLPPYGIDTTPTDDQKPSDHPSPSNSNNYQRAQGQNSGNFLTVSLLPDMLYILFTWNNLEI